MMEWFANWNWVDWSFVAVLLVGAGMGAWRGLSHELAILLSFAVAWVVTCAGYAPLAGWLWERTGWNLELLRLMAIILLLLACMAAMWALRMVLGALMSFAFKGWFEKVGGAVAGCVRWGLVFLVLLMGLCFIPSSTLQRAILLQSATGRNLMPVMIDFYNVLSEKAGTMAAEVPVGVRIPTMVMPPAEGESW